MNLTTRLLKWRKTRIGGQIVPGDYSGALEGSPGGCRVYRSDATTTSPGGWRWFANGTHAIGQGFEEDLGDAVAKAEEGYAAWLARRA